MKKYIKPKTVVIKIDDWPLLAASGKTFSGGSKSYTRNLNGATSVGLSLNEDNRKGDKKWY